MGTKAGLWIDHRKAIVVSVIEITELMHDIKPPCEAFVEVYGL
jgi:hypothetical protein